MPLKPGARLGPYEIQASAGAGGMGEVYRARDTRLDRSVAIKVLPADVSGDAERRERMRREARAISSLQHPNICALYDIGSENGTDFLVMEFLEGETLADRLERGPLPLSQALKVGAEIAAALAKAHKTATVHRDLKPGNVMLTSAGAKLMDFGLAKPLMPVAGTSDGATMSAPVTTRGLVVGTVPYMAPEQLEAGDCDARSDIFALGAVLYEMITGRRAFPGTNQASVIASILARDPEPISTFQPLTPPALDGLIRICLARDPDERWQSAQDVATQLSLVAGAPRVESAAPPRRVAALVAWVALLLLALGCVGAVLAWRLWPATTPRSLARLSVVVPPPFRLDASNYGPPAPAPMALSQDGATLAYTATESTVNHLLLRRLDGSDTVRVPQSDGATAPFFSPDGRLVAFASGNQILVAPVDGGPATSLAHVPGTPGGGTWSEAGVIVVGVRQHGLMKIAAGSGRVDPLSIASVDGKAVAASIEEARTPAFLPGGDTLVYTAIRGRTPRVAALTMTTGQARTIVENASHPAYAAGHLLYFSQGKLWAAPFDASTLALTGKPVAVVDDLYGRGQYAVSARMLCYAASTNAGRRELVWVGSGGSVETAGFGAADYADASVSPDGTRVAVVLRSPREVGTQELQIYDLRNGTVMQVQTPPATTFAAAPVWTTDGKSIVYMVSDPPGSGPPGSAILRSAANGSGIPERIAEFDGFTFPTSVAPDGTIAVTRSAATQGSGIALVGSGARSFSPDVQARQAVFAPDGRWLAYTGVDSAGNAQVFVQAFPGPGARYQISTDGGVQPLWAPDARRLYYRNGSKMYTVAVQVQGEFSAGRPVLVFDKEFDRGGSATNYGVGRDGRLLMVQSTENNEREIRILVDWAAALRR